MTEHEALRRISDMAHHAANGGYKPVGKKPRIGDYNRLLRFIRDIADDAKPA